MHLIPPYQLLAKVSQMNRPLMCVVALQTKQTGYTMIQSHHDIQHGLAVTDPTLSKVRPLKACYEVTTVEDAIKDLNVGGILFALPCQETIVPIDNFLDENVDYELMDWQRTAFIKYVRKFVNDRTVAGSVLERRRVVSEARRNAKEHPERWNYVQWMLDERREHHPPRKGENLGIHQRFTVSLDAAVTLIDFLWPYSKNTSEEDDGEQPPNAPPVEEEDGRKKSEELFKFPDFKVD